jgi:hypothetical protein
MNAVPKGETSWLVRIDFPIVIWLERLLGSNHLKIHAMIAWL